MTAPWVCPVCNRGIAPGVMTCNHGGNAVQYPPVYLPQPTWLPRPGTGDPYTPPYSLIIEPDPSMHIWN